MKKIVFITVIITLSFAANAVAQNLEPVNSYPLPQSPREMAYSNNCVYITDPYDGVYVWDISDYDNPIVLDTIANPDDYYCQYLQINNSYLFCICKSIGTGADYGLLRIIDISNPSEPTEVSQIDLGIRIWKCMAKHGNFLFVGGESSTTHVYDITDINSPTLLTNFQSGGMKADMHVIGDYLYITSGATGLDVYDISNPSNCHFVGNYDDNDAFIFDFAIGNDIAFIANLTNVLIVDVSFPANPSYITEYAVEDSLAFPYTDLLLDNDYLYVPVDTSIYSIDVSDPGYPVQVSSIGLSDDPMQLIKDGEYIYSLNYDSFTILRNYPLAIDDKPESRPGTISLAQNYPNPFNASTTIRYELPYQSQVTIDIYDMLGRKITSLENVLQPAGYHQVSWYAEDVSSGMYFYKITAGDYSQSDKMMLVK